MTSIAEARAATPAADNAVSNLRNALAMISMVDLDSDAHTYSPLVETMRSIEGKLTLALEQIAVAQVSGELSGPLTQDAKDFLRRHGPKLFTAILDELNAVRRMLDDVSSDRARLRAVNRELEEGWRVNR